MFVGATIIYRIYGVKALVSSNSKPCYARLTARQRAIAVAIYAAFAFFIFSILPSVSRWVESCKQFRQVEPFTSIWDTPYLFTSPRNAALFDRFVGLDVDPSTHTYAPDMSVEWYTWSEGLKEVQPQSVPWYRAFFSAQDQKQSEEAYRSQLLDRADWTMLCNVSERPSYTASPSSTEYSLLDHGCALPSNMFQRYRAQLKNQAGELAVTILLLVAIVLATRVAADSASSQWALPAPAWSWDLLPPKNHVVDLAPRYRNSVHTSPTSRRPAARPDLILLLRLRQHLYDREALLPGPLELRPTLEAYCEAVEQRGVSFPFAKHLQTWQRNVGPLSVEALNYAQGLVHAEKRIPLSIRVALVDNVLRFVFRDADVLYGSAEDASSFETSSNSTVSDNATAQGSAVTQKKRRRKTAGRGTPIRPQHTGTTTRWLGDSVPSSKHCKLRGLGFTSLDDAADGARKQVQW